MSWYVAATMSLLAWGALAFGAVYPWAFVPLFLGCAAVGMAALVQYSESTPIEKLIVASLGLLLAAIGVQLIPMPIGFIQWASPETDALLRQYEVGYSAAQSHTLSIEPRATMLALAAAGALCILLLGLARALKDNDTRHIARGATVLGVVLAVAGIVQKALWNGRIYGFWTPMEEALSFGPFVNRNHFAGWMLMAMPLAIGYLCGRVARGMRRVERGWRNRLIWFSSADASETILVAFGVFLMALALVLSMSRSGALGLLAAVMLFGWFVARRQGTAARRAVVTAYLTLMLLVVGGWTGADRLAARFAEGDAVTLGNRLGVWGDTWRIVRQFPATGTGVNTYGTSMLFYQTAGLEKHFAQAHNDYLQVLAEGGVLVGIPVILVALIFVRTIHRRFRDMPDEGTDYWMRVGAVMGIATISLQEIGDFSLQMPGNAVMFVVLLALAVRHPSAAGRLNDREER
jgi:O-antigen ligase